MRQVRPCVPSRIISTGLGVPDYLLAIVIEQLINTRPGHLPLQRMHVQAAFALPFVEGISNVCLVLVGFLECRYTREIAVSTIRAMSPAGPIYGSVGSHARLFSLDCGQWLASED